MQDKLDQYLTPRQGGERAVVWTRHWERWTHRLFVFLKAETNSEQQRNHKNTWVGVSSNGFPIGLKLISLNQLNSNRGVREPFILSLDQTKLQCCQGKRRNQVHADEGDQSSK